MESILGVLKALIPYLPTLIIAYAIIKLLSSGLGLVSKILSTLILCVLAYLTFVWLSGII